MSSDDLTIENLLLLPPGGLFKFNTQQCKLWNIKRIRYRFDRLDEKKYKEFIVEQDDPVLLLLDIEIEKVSDWVYVDHLVFFYDNKKLYVDTSEAACFKELKT